MLFIYLFICLLLIYIIYLLEILFILKVFSLFLECSFNFFLSALLLVKLRDRLFFLF